MRKQTDNGNTFRESVATYMEALMARRDFAGAIDYYEAHRGLLAEADGSWAGKLLHQAAKAYASLTRYNDALKTARRAQATVGSQGDSLLLADIFVTLGQILRDSGEVTEAEKAYRDAESIFRRNDNPEGQSRALNQLAALFFRRADYRNALSILMDAVDIARRLGDKKKLAFMMGNIGRLFTFMGDLAQAEKNLKINVELSTDLKDDLETARARLSLGYLYIQKADYNSAGEELNSAYGLIVTLNAPREEIIYRTYLGELLYRTGRFDEARDTLGQALIRSEKASTDSTMTGRVLRHLAELEVRTGRFRTAWRFAARARTIMETVGDKVELGATMKIIAQVASHHQQEAEAQKGFMKAIDLLDEAGVRWEKAEALVAAGSSPVFTERQRITYLFRAEEFYSRARLSRKLEPLNRMISELHGFASAPANRTEPTAEDVDYYTVCPEILRFKKQLPMLSRTDLPVLITGETGSGKDRLARYFHSLVRPDGPYVAINCASVPHTLLESELFGYRKGAFTGADSNKKGLFVAANGGVLLLDEIGDMPPTLQAKLLGVLENRKVLPLGGTEEQEIDIILVAATNRNLEEMVEQGTFRRDLYYRLSGITFHLPPLRERKEDIPLLLEYFMRRRKLLGQDQKIPTDLVRQFLDYSWPGNIRELDNKVKRLEVMAQLVAEGDLVEISRSMFGGEEDQSSPGTLFDRMEQFERQLITDALLAAGGNKSKAARLLGIHEATVRTKLKRYGLESAAVSAEGGLPN